MAGRRDTGLRHGLGGRLQSCSMRMAASSPSIASRGPFMEPAAAMPSSSAGRETTKWSQPMVTAGPNCRMTAHSKAKSASSTATTSHSSRVAQRLLHQPAKAARQVKGRPCGSRAADPRSSPVLPLPPDGDSQTDSVRARPLRIPSLLGSLREPASKGSIPGRLSAERQPDCASAGGVAASNAISQKEQSEVRPALTSPLRSVDEASKGVQTSVLGRTLLASAASRGQPMTMRQRPEGGKRT